jgi:hypothetical protein
MVLLTIALLGALVGWFLGRDPSLLTGVLGTLGVSQVGLEAGNVGKRATYKQEAVDAELRRA